MGITYVRRPFDLPTANVLYNHSNVDLDHASIEWGFLKRDQICELSVFYLSYRLLVEDHLVKYKGR